MAHASIIPSNISTRKEYNAIKVEKEKLFHFAGNPKTTFRHRDIVSSTVDLGVKIDGRKHLNSFKSIRGYESVYDNHEYFVSIVIYPKKERVINFNKIFAEVSEAYPSVLLPVFVLLNGGVFGSWFALYFRKNPLVIGVGGSG